MKLLLTAFALTVGVAATASAQASTANQLVTFTVTDVNTIAVSGDPAAMSVGAGGPGNTDTDASTTYDVVSNATAGSPKTITAQLDLDMPTGVTLDATLAAPAGAASTGPQSLVSAMARNVVTGISNVTSTGNTITYTLTATTAAQAVAGATRTVTLTIQ
jgi:uncharacterized protein YceK